MSSALIHHSTPMVEMTPFNGLLLVAFVSWPSIRRGDGEFV